MTVIELSAKDRIIRSAEQLFAEQGLDNTSLREISTHAGQKNTSAVQYHFNSKSGLIAAIWQRHAEIIENERRVMLQSLENDPSLQSLVECLVVPYASRLNDEDESGRYYLQIMSQLISYQGMNALDFARGRVMPGMEQIITSMVPYIQHLDEEDVACRKLIAAGMLFHGLADYIRLTQSHSELTLTMSTATIKKNLIDMTVATFTAPQES